MDPLIWLSQFLEARSQQRPDAEKPLYAYRCTNAELDELGEMLRTTTPPPIGYTQVTRGGAAAFCLFASEWWRHNHEGGPWKWAGILEAVGWEDVQPLRLYPVIEQGLGYWGRPLLRIGPNRGFLITLACEGGLPLRLLQHEGAALRNYFLAVLEEFQLYRGGGVPARELASRTSSLLPRSLRQDVVYQVTGQLIDEVWQLQRRVGDSATPVLDLDRLDPTWRDRLPLLVDDDVARALLNPLVEKAAKLARGGAAALRLHRSLRKSGGEWVPGSEVAVPSTLSAMQLRDLFGGGTDELPSRFEL